MANEFMAPPDLSTLGGPQDIQATVNSLESQIAAAPPLGQRQYEQALKHYQTHQPGLPPQEIERLALNDAVRNVNAIEAEKNSALQAKQAAQAKAAQETAAQDQQRIQLGLIPQAPATPAEPAAQLPDADPSQFAVQQVPAQAAQVPGAQEQSGISGTYNTQQRANQAIAEAAAQKSSLDSIAQAELEDKLVESQAREEKIRNEFNTKHAERTAQLDDLSKQLGAQDFTTAQVDSKRLWNNMGTGQKILAGLAVFLGGASASANGGKNGALDIINGAIDRDIAEQKQNIANSLESKTKKAQNLRDQSNVQQNMLSDLRQKFGSDVQAESALRSLMIQQTQNKLNQIASGNASKTVMANAQNLNAQLEREKLVHQANLKASMAAQASMANMGSGQALTPMQEAALPKDLRDAYISNRERSVPGFIGNTTTKENAQKFAQYITEVQPAVDGVNRILAQSKDMNRITDLETRQIVATEIKALVGQLRLPFTGPGQLTEKEYDRLLDTVGDPNKLAAMSQWERVKLQTVLRKIESDIASNAATYGLRRAGGATKSKLRPY
jgi:hypothetical protein